MAKAHNLGFPRIGANREMKQAVESYWKEEIDQEKLNQAGKSIRQANWSMQKDLDYLPVAEFTWYDHVLDTSLLLGAIPPRFACEKDKEGDINTLFQMARGRAPGKKDVHACEMTKWFDTNYHYIVPELHENQEFKITSQKLFQEVKEALNCHLKPKPVLLGPLSYLWLAKTKDSQFNKLDLLEKIVLVYQEILERLQHLGIEWIQIDEPILVLELPSEWKKAFEKTYTQLQKKK